MTNVEDIVNKEYIDKHEAYSLLKQKAETYMLPATKEAYEKAAILIDSLPTIEAQPVKHGKWENDKSDIPRCSCCSYIPEFNRHIDDYYYSDFCPNCGARMGGGSE